MACSWVAKLSKEVLPKELSTYHQSRHGELGNLNFLSSILFRRFNSEVSASEQMNLIRQLREKTSAPIKEVKAALVSCNWDVEAAHKDLRKRGVVLASKKSSRTAAGGLLALSQDDSRAVVVEFNCETDFVARNEIFQYLGFDQGVKRARQDCSSES